MIDYDTILSTTEDKMTLLQWLKKVEAALKDASATSFKVNKKGDATISFSIVFADGTELESGEIILQQGEGVQSAAIVNGHLILTLTNGDELDAGDLGGVTSFSIDASQHLIVHYQNGTTQDLGAIFSGNVNIAGNFTADSIIENMSGYSMTPQSVSNLILDNVYGGVVKNGNKLTIAYATKITRTGSIPTSPSNHNLLSIFIPSSVGQKLYPAFGSLTLARVNVLLTDISVTQNDIIVPFSVFKISNGALNMVCNYQALGTLVENRQYYARVEVTFLLSDNLIA